MSVPHPSARDTRPLGAASEPSESGTAYLLVLEGDSSWRFPLPDEGMVLVGRDEHADLKLRDDMSHEEIARHLGITTRMVRRLLTTAYMQLRDRIDLD